ADSRDLRDISPSRASTGRPFASRRRYSTSIPPLESSRDCRSAPLPTARRLLASADGGLSGVLGTPCAQAAWMIGSQIGTARPPPVVPPPSVRRLPSALS